MSVKIDKKIAAPDGAAIPKNHSIKNVSEVKNLPLPKQILHHLQEPRQYQDHCVRTGCNQRSAQCARKAHHLLG